MKKIAIIVVLIVVLIGVGIGVFMGMQKPMIKKALEEGLSSVIGAPAVVSNLEIDKESGKILIDQILIANFDGFFSQNLAQISNVELDCNVKDFLFKKGVSCEHVKATINQIWVDRSTGSNNLRQVKALTSEDLKNEVTAIVTRVKRAEIVYGKVTVTESTGQGNRKTVVDLKNRPEVYGYITDLRVFPYLAALKVLGELNRGSLGIPRHLIQQRVLATTGQKN